MPKAMVPHAPRLLKICFDFLSHWADPENLRAAVPGAVAGLDQASTAAEVKGKSRVKALFTTCV